MAGRLINKLLPTTSDISNVIKSNKIVLFAKTFCPFCAKTVELLNRLNKDYATIELDKIENGNQIQTTLFNMTGQRTVPSVFFSGSHIGGYSDLIECYESNQLEVFEKNAIEIKKLCDNKDHKYDYDLAIIGGGSGGLACAQRAKSHGAKVVIYDYVKPTPHGAVWGLGGTCVNVGCVPKKLFHQSAIIGENIKNCSSYGWQTPPHNTHNWSELVENVQNHIKSLNFQYRSTFRKNDIVYINKQAKLSDNHTIIHVDDEDGKQTKVTAKFIVLATGERPIYPNVEGDKEYCVTSDDIFSLPYPPGKTLVIGASYVALECAGFLHGFGYDTTVMVRSILLRGFDQEMANKIGDYMEANGIKFLKQCTPQKFHQISPIDFEGKKAGLIEVTYKDSNNILHKDQFNTILLAVGRQTIVRETNAEEVGVKLDPKLRVIGIAGTEMTHVSNIFAIGDILADKLQLTPMAVQSGKLLADRLFGNDIYNKCDYSNVATTVFTPLEYGCIGMSEDAAKIKFGDDIDVLHNYVHYLESTIIEDSNPTDYYAKIITRPSLNNKVIGLHILAPNAGEITQGFSIGFRMGATAQDFSSIIGIHPTCAEVFTTLTVSKKKGNSIKSTGC